MSTHEIPSEQARAVSAAAVGEEVELLVIGEDGQPRAYRIGLVGARTLHLMLAEANRRASLEQLYGRATHGT